MYGTILFPTDGSDGADAALERAVDLAETYGASIRVLFVLNTTYLGSADPTVTGIEELREHADTVVEETVERIADRDVEVIGETRDGVPYEEILAAAEDGDVDVIVMGTHGRSGLGRYLLGSVTEKVIRTADVPVLTVPMPGGE